MNFSRLSMFLVVLFWSLVASAQQGPPPSSPPAEAKQFDFLIGQWELDVKPKINGLVAMIHGTPKLVGIWKATRAFDGFGIDDEMRIIDSSGNPASLSHALRVYSPSEHHWVIAGIDAYRGRASNSTGEWRDGEMIVNGTSIDSEGKPVLTRARFGDIKPDSFRLQQDRSSDNGASWDEAVLVIEAKRAATAAAQ